MKSTTSFLIIVVSIAVLALYAWPQWQTVSALQDKHAELQDAQFKAQELTQLRNNLIAQYDAIPNEEIQKVRKVVPAEYNPIKLAADINAIALRQGMVVREVSFADTQDMSSTGDGSIVDAPPATPYKVVRVSLSTEGQYRNFISLISDLERNLQLLDITNVDIVTKTEGERGSLPVLDFKIILDTYWMN